MRISFAEILTTEDYEGCIDLGPPEELLMMLSKCSPRFLQEHSTQLLQRDDDDGHRLAEFIRRFLGL